MCSYPISSPIRSISDSRSGIVTVSPSQTSEPPLISKLQLSSAVHQQPLTNRQVVTYPLISLLALLWALARPFPNGPDCHLHYPPHSPLEPALQGVPDTLRTVTSATSSVTACHFFFLFWGVVALGEAERGKGWLWEFLGWILASDVKNGQRPCLWPFVPCVTAWANGSRCEEFKNWKAKVETPWGHLQKLPGVSKTWFPETISKMTEQ